MSFTYIFIQALEYKVASFITDNNDISGEMIADGKDILDLHG